jgi:hypothetical protein
VVGVYCQSKPSIVFHELPLASMPCSSFLLAPGFEHVVPFPLVSPISLAKSRLLVSDLQAEAFRASILLAVPPLWRAPKVELALGVVVRELLFLRPDITAPQSLRHLLF